MLQDGDAQQGRADVQLREQEVAKESLGPAWHTCTPCMPSQEERAEHLSTLMLRVTPAGYCHPVSCRDTACRLGGGTCGSSPVDAGLHWSQALTQVLVEALGATGQGITPQCSSAPAVML